MSALLISILAVTQLPGDPGPGKAPIPAGHELSKALALVKEVYGDKYAEAKTPEAKRVLAETLLEKVPGTTTPVNRCALLQVARDIAVAAGDGKTAYRAIELLDEFFCVDAMKMKAAALHSFSEQAGTNAEHLSVTEQAILLAEAAVASDDFAIAAKLANLAFDGARKGRSSTLLKQVTESRERLESLAKAYEKVAPELAVLKDRPDDADANLVVGTYRCFMKGEWDTGLPMLALGSDAKLKDLAIEDLRRPSSPAEKAALGDRWWDFASAAGAPVQSGAQDRALLWYREALPGLSGLMKDKIEKRLSVSDNGNAEEPKAFDVLALMKRDDRKLSPPWAWERGGGVGVYAKESENIVLPIALTGDYDLRVSFTRLRGHQWIGIRHPIRSQQCRYALSASDNSQARWIGLGREKRVRFKLANGVKHTVDLSIRTQGDQAAVRVRMNGRPHLQWTGAITTEGNDALSAGGRLELGVFAIKTNPTHIVFHEILVIARDGEVEFN
jgi:hypothetical protein